MSSEQLRLEVEGAGSVSAALDRAGGDWLFVYAPGAGSNLNDPFGTFAGRTLPESGISLLRFQFPYQERGRSGPDGNALLEATWRAAIETARSARAGTQLVAGGRSMGGRIASQVAAAGTAVDALALFAYPLHPPGHPEKARDSHLASITAPTLFCSGTRDAFGSPEELQQAASAVPRSSLHFLDGADHGFAVPKSSGRTREDVWIEACEALARFLREIQTAN